MEKQVIHGIVQSNMANNLFISVIYAANSHSEREDLWRSSLALLQILMRRGYCLGTLTVVAFRRRKSLIPIKLKSFNDCILNAGLTDLTYHWLFYILLELTPLLDAGWTGPWPT